MSHAGAVARFAVLLFPLVAGCGATTLITPLEPDASLTAAPDSVAPGGSSTLTWLVTEATDITIDQGIGAVGATGATAVTPAVTTIYTLTATGLGGTKTASATVTVVPPPVASLTATPAIVHAGTASTLSWSVTGATSVSIDQGVGEVAAAGERAVTPTVSTTYTLTASNAFGTTVVTATVTVSDEPSVTFTATPAVVGAGATSTLAWTALGAMSVTIDQGIGPVSAVGQQSVTVAASTTYTLTATNAVGSTTATATVTVVELPQVTFGATPAEITAGGSSTLSWAVVGADSVSIDRGIGAVAASGQTTVTLAATTAYTLSAVNAAGTTTASATVVVHPAGPVPEGWLYTKAGDNKLYLRSAGVESVWVGRGVNLDDLFLCGYNWGLWMSAPSGGDVLLGVAEGLVSQWRPTLVRVSLSMASNSPVVGWTTNLAQYHDPMVAVITALGAHPGVYVLVSLRSDASMDCATGEATCIPTAATDALFEALVTDFHDAPYVLFGAANEPGGSSATDAALRSTMSHVVDVIRAKEDALGSPHHIVVVQGNSWTSALGLYATSPLAQENVAYEYHAYPPAAAGYTFSNLPVIIGEYAPTSAGSTLPASFFTDVEAKQISTAAWDFEPYSDCAPDLVGVTRSTSTFTPTTWGAQVKAYLAAH